MELISQNETLLNLIFCVLIVFLGYLTYNKRKNPLIVYIIASFGLFGLSHYFTYTNQAKNYESFLMVIRFVAYLLVLLALFNFYKNKK